MSGGYVIRESEPGLWTVGHNEGPRWEPFADYGDEAEAAAWCAYLNGGTHPDYRDRPAARDELDTRHMAVALAVEDHKHRPRLTVHDDSDHTDRTLILTAAAIAAFLRDGTVPGDAS